MEPKPDPSQAVTEAVKDKLAETATTMSAARRAQLVAMFAPPPPAGPAPVTVANIAAAVGGGAARNRIANTRFELGVAGGSINLYLRGRDERIGHITGPLQGTVALVETVKVEDAFKGQGLGRLLAVAYYEHVAGQGALHVGLGTPDTSGGFWDSQGVAMGGRTGIAAARARPNNQNFTIG
jgi:GNAT superfamily N-acetyltransferase